MAHWKQDHGTAAAKDALRRLTSVRKSEQFLEATYETILVALSDWYQLHLKANSLLMTEQYSIDQFAQLGCSRDATFAEYYKLLQIISDFRTLRHSCRMNDKRSFESVDS